MREAHAPGARIALPGRGAGWTGNRSRGGAKLRALIWLLLLFSGGYVAYKVVPIYFANYQLQDKMETEARFAVVNHKADEDVREVIYREIRDRDIQARREDIHVQTSERGVRISVDYTVTVNLRVYQLQLHFTPTVESRVL